MSDAPITLTYRIETAGDIGRLAEKIASDQTTGTFVAVPGETADIKARCAARVADIRRLEPHAHPVFPQDAVEHAVEDGGPRTGPIRMPAPTSISSFRSTSSAQISRLSSPLPSAASSRFVDCPACVSSG